MSDGAAGSSGPEPDGLKTAYRDLADRVGGFGDPDRVIAARRRRMTLTVGVPALAAMLVVGVVAAVQVLPGDDASRIATSEKRSEEKPAGGAASRRSGPDALFDTPGVSVRLIDGEDVTFADWVQLGVPRNADVPPSVEAGTFLARWCGRDASTNEQDEDGETCAGYLIRPNGAAFRLDDLNPRAGAAVAEYGLEGATLAPHGGLLGVRTDDGGYEIHGLADGEVERLEPDSDDSHWEPVSVGSKYLILAQYLDGRVLEYIKFWGPRSTASARDLGPTRSVFNPPEGYAAQLVENWMVQPVDGSDGSSARPRMTGYAPKALHRLIDLAQAQSDGTDIEQLQPNGDQRVVDFADHLSDEETLAGSRGVPIVYQRAKEVFFDGDLAFYPVFRTDGAEPTPVAMLIPAVSAYERVDLPASTAEAAWSLLGPLDESTVGVLLQERGSALSQVVAIAPNGRQDVMHQLPSEAEVLGIGSTMW